VETKIAEYGRSPTVWDPPAAPVPRSLGQRLSALVRTVRAAVAVLLFLAGPPACLWWVFGNPLERLPTWQHLWDWLNQPGTWLTLQAVTGAVIWAVWLIWAVVALLLVAELIAVATRWRVPALRLPVPLHRLVFGLAGTAAITLTTAGRTGAAPPVAADAGTGTAPAVAAVAAQQQAQQGPATIHVAEKSYVYVVKRRDTLSKISKEWLGDADRWPEICQLNWHRHWPKAGGVLRDCDLIHPGWELSLPADAIPPASATPVPPPAPPAQARPDPRLVTPVQPRPEPSATAVTPHAPDSVVETPTTSPPTRAPATSAQPDNSPAPSAAANPPHPADPGPPPPPSADRTGVNLPGGSFVTWSLAAAITAAAALVWLQRRRRYIPGTYTQDLDSLPPPVVELQRQIARRPDLPIPDDLAERAAAVPALPAVPLGGVGVSGDGAQAAARAALVSALASGGPHDPDRRSEVVIDHTTLTTLLGADVVTLGPWPRLHVANDIDHALTLIESRLLHRARILDEHSLTDLDTLRDRAPGEEALPPVLLICHTPPPAQSTRVRVTLGLGTGLDVSALLLGDWSDGTTIDVAADGRTRPTGALPADGISERVDVLDTQSALTILATLREAHTGQPVPTIAIPRQRTPHSPDSADEPRADDTEQQPAADHAGSGGLSVPDGAEQATASLRVLGPPRIENITLPGRSLRGKAAELAVYLACHPDGADTRTIGEYLAPESRLRQADQQIHTNASNLRHVLGRAAGPRPGGYVIKRGAKARYRLDPTTVDVDLWQLRDLLGRANLASAPARTELLQQACDLYAAPLAEGCDYEWVEPHREKARQWATEAHLLLADDLLAADPQAASDLLDKAISLDRYNEELYRKAMHARHALHNPDGIGSLLRALTKALSDLDAEPAEATVELAAHLHADLDKQ
jgi:hypothetical protein